MKKTLYFAFTLCLFFSITAFAQDKKVTVKADAAKEVVKEVKKEAGKAVNTVCPVSGEEIDKAFTATYEGKTYSVCCKRCLTKFQKDPAKYVKNLSEDGKKFIK